MLEGCCWTVDAAQAVNHTVCLNAVQLQKNEMSLLK